MTARAVLPRTFLPPTVRPPTILPKENAKVEKRVFLEGPMWEELEDTAKFHSEAYAAMGVNETLSRNDLIEQFLRWALTAFWLDKGGVPKSSAEREKKVAAFAEFIKAEKAKHSQSR